MCEFESHHRLHNLARVPGVGLLNRTCKSWVERHEVQLLRGLPIISFKLQVSSLKVTDIELETLNLKLETIPGCVAQAELE